MNKQTAVKWLETKVNGMIENGGDADLLAVIEHIQQAKEIEKSQIMNSWAKGVISDSYMTAEQYYNKTYK